MNILDIVMAAVESKIDTDDLHVGEDGLLAWRKLADGRILSLGPLTYGRTRLMVGPNLTSWVDGF